MKRIFALVLIFCFGLLSSAAFGQDKNTKDKKGGFSVGGYDNTRQEKEPTVTKRSVVINEEAAPQEKAMEIEEAPKPAPAQAPAPAPPVASDKQKENQGNAYGKDKGGLEGKDFGQTRANDAKEKQKARKSKTKRR